MRQRDLIQERGALAGELGVPHVTPLHVDDDRQHVGLERAAVPELQPPAGVQQDPEGLGRRQRVHRQHVKLVGEAAVALGERPEHLGRHLGQHPHRTPLHVRPQHVRHRQVALGRGAGPVQAEEVVEVQHVVAGPGLVENRQQALFPLTDGRHARDQPLRRQQPDPAAFVPPPPPFLPAPHRAVDDGRLPDHARADERDRPPVARRQQPVKMGDLAVAVQRAVDLVGIQPVEASAAPVQLDVAVHRPAPEQRRQLVPRFLARRLPGVEADVNGRNPRAPRERERIEPGVGPPLVLDEAPEVRRDHPFGRRAEILSRGDLEPQIGHARREGDDPAERSERHEEKAALDDVPAKIDGKLALTSLQRGREQPGGQLLVRRFATTLTESFVELPRQLRHGSAQVPGAGLRTVEEQRAATVNPRLAVPRLGRLDVNRKADYHSPSSESMRSKSRRSTAADMASSILSKENRFPRAASTTHCSEKS